MKKAIVQQILERLRSDHAAAVKRAKDSAEAATHEENRPESDKDMRATEASYIARGQAGRASELAEAILQIEGMELRTFTAEDVVTVGALVTAEAEGNATRYFVLPAAGGATLVTPNGPIRTVTPASPLGRAMLGLAVGDEAEVQSPDGVKVVEIVNIS